MSVCIPNSSVAAVKMLWQLLLLAAALGAAYYRWSRRRLHRLARELPSGLPEHPLLGQANMFYGNGEDQMKALQTFARVSNQYNGLTSIWLGNKLFISMTDPQCIELVTKTCLDKDEYLSKFMRTMIGNGSLFAPVNIWHPRRKIIAPFFGLKNLVHAVKVFDEQSQIMVKLLRAEAGLGDFPIWHYMTSYNLDTIVETIGDMKMNYQGNSDNCLLRQIDEEIKMLVTRILQPWMHLDFIYKRLPVYQSFTDLRKRIYDFIDEMIQHKRQASVVGIKKNRLTSMFDIVMQSSEGKEQGYSDIELREEATVMAVAGVNTTAAAASFTAVLLSRYPDVQDKVYRELQEVFGDSDRSVAAEDMPRLKYLEAVIKESLRLYPPAPIILREVHKDLLLPSGMTLPKGVSVMINIWGTHRNPAYWGSDPVLFRPERFLEGPLRHPAQFIPFSYSDRNCIGSTYAMMSVKTSLANLLRRYRLLPPANMAAVDFRRPPRVEFEITMKDVDKCILRVEERPKVV